MKKLIIITVILISTASFAQNKNAKVSVKVDGVCMMCKARIEKASLNTKGVKSAIWNMDTHELKLIYDERKTDVKTVKTNIVATGHDTEDMKAKDEVYKTIDNCCQYRDPNVVNSH